MLIEKINNWAELCPQRTAHQQRGQKLTYSSLKKASDALASWLYNEAKHREIPRGTPVLVYGHKESEMPVCFLGCVKAGFPYIPVDSSIPSERVRLIRESSGAKIILSPQRVPEGVRQEGVTVADGLALDQTGELNLPGRDITANLPLLLREWQVRENEVYYIIYTSGSTGVPKGVQITLGALESFLNWVNSAFQPKEKNEVFLNQAPFSFDLSVMDLYMSLSTGGTLWSVDKHQIANLKELFASLGDSGISYWVSTPSFAEVCLMDRNFGQTLLPQVKRFLFCGEILTHDCASKLNQRFPGAKVENLYGPTEATVAVTNLTITPEILSRYNPLPVGWVKPDAEILICSTAELSAGLAAAGGALAHRPQALPEGEAGEMIIAGPNVSTGYLNNPQQNAKSFFTWQENGQTRRAYRTGDAGVFRDGLLFYLGRLDFQVKLHGYRIELGEIEEGLRRIPLVENAVVLPIERRGKVDYLQAFITVGQPVEDEFAAIQTLREGLRACLPDYMIPRRFKFLDQMPMTLNGKVDRRALLGG